MRVVVTGCLNPFGRAIVEALAKAGHQVRAFGVPIGEDPFPHLADVQVHPGQIEVVGSIEPVLSQREALVHAACLDAPGKDRRAHAAKIERGTISARYGAEREMLDHFIHLTPQGDRTFGAVQEKAAAEARATRGAVNTRVVVATDPDATAREVVRLLGDLPQLGFIPGANDAVTA